MLYMMLNTILKKKKQANDILTDTDGSTWKVYGGVHNKETRKKLREHGIKINKQK